MQTLLASLVLGLAAAPALAASSVPAFDSSDSMPGAITTLEAHADLKAVQRALSKASASTGVAFVHGTGKQTAAYSSYWTVAMVDSVRRGLPNVNNWVAINCDFTQYMWNSQAAGCLAGQLQSFIATKGITDLVVITHSNGGNVMRWILSNPTYDSRYPRHRLEDPLGQRPGAPRRPVRRSPTR